MLKLITCILTIAYIVLPDRAENISSEELVYETVDNTIKFQAAFNYPMPDGTYVSIVAPCLPQELNSFLGVEYVKDVQYSQAGVILDKTQWYYVYQWYDP